MGERGSSVPAAGAEKESLLVHRDAGGVDGIRFGDGLQITFATKSAQPGSHGRH